MEVVEENMHRVSAGVAGEPHYEDLFPETISLSFALNSGDTVHLSLRRNRNINSDVPVYTHDGQPTVTQWNPPSNHVSRLIFGRSRSARFSDFYHPPTKLREGNVFTGLCHSVHGGRYLWSHVPSGGRISEGIVYLGQELGYLGVGHLGG